MKRTVLMTCILLLAAGRLQAVESDIDGAVPGKWTMDLEAAKKVAADRKLPILLDFSGSDWCGWCQLMETNVFMKPEWTAYATGNVMMVLIDFPNDKSLVPEKYTERNQALNAQYGIEGYPTFVILDDDGATELGRLGAGREKNPESFIAELRKLFRSRAAETARFIESLDPEKKAAYEELADRLAKTRAMIDEQMKIAEAANARAEELQQAESGLNDEMETFRLKQLLSEDDFKAYEELKGRYDAAIKKLTEWIATDPEGNDDNIKLYQEMVAEIQALEEQILKY